MKIKVVSKLDERLNEIYKETGIRITKSWLARKIHADPSQLYRWTKNKEDGFVETLPNVGHMILLSNILKCSVNDLFEVFAIPKDQDLFE